METYEEEMNKNEKLTWCTRRLRKRVQVRDKYKVCVLNMFLEVFTE